MMLTKGIVCQSVMMLRQGILHEPGDKVYWCRKVDAKARKQERYAIGGREAKVAALPIRASPENPHTRRNRSIGFEGGGGHSSISSSSVGGRRSSSTPRPGDGEKVVYPQKGAIFKVKTPGEREEDIDEDAVCTVCWKSVTDHDNVLKRNCGCSRTLVHDSCANQSNIRRGYCDKDTVYIPVMLMRASNETPSSSNNRSSNWKRLFKRSV